jgi:hypothetical protein
MSRYLKGDVASVARLPDVTLEGITIDDDFIQQQEAIMRDFGNITVEQAEMGKASSPPPRRTFKKKPTGIKPPPLTSPHIQDKVDTSNASNENLDTNFCDSLNDAELIREQHRIFEEIQRQHEAKPSAKDKDDLYATQNPTQKQVDSLTETVSETSMNQGLRRMQHLHAAATATTIDQTRGIHDKSSETVPSDKVIACSQDRMTRLGNGRKLRIKGTQHAYMSIARGTAIIVTCPCCQTVLQVDASTKLLYCTRCQHVSPIDLTTSPTSNGSNAGLRDHQIAGSVQQQEIDVAYARKMAKFQH